MARTANRMSAALLALLVIAVVLAVRGESRLGRRPAARRVSVLLQHGSGRRPVHFASAFELGTDEKQEHTLSVTMLIST
jgi:hypothetical protein